MVCVPKNTFLVEVPLLAPLLVHFIFSPSTWNRAAELWGYIEVEVCYMQLQVKHQCNVDDPYTAQAAVTISWRKSNHF